MQAVQPVDSTATWSVQRLAAPEPASVPAPALRRPRGSRCMTASALVLLVVAGQMLMHCKPCKAAQLAQPAHHAHLHTGASTASLRVPVATEPPLAAATALAPATAVQQSRAKDDYDDDYDDDKDDYDDYDYYGTRKKKKKKPAAGAQAAAVSPSETNLFNFVRIMVLRLVWGFASWFGFDEPLSEAFGGAFVPPGVDPDGDDDFGFDY